MNTVQQLTGCCVEIKKKTFRIRKYTDIKLLSSQNYCPAVRHITAAQTRLKTMV